MLIKEAGVYIIMLFAFKRERVELKAFKEDNKKTSFQCCSKESTLIQN